MYNTQIIPDISTDGYYAVYIKYEITPITNNNQDHSEIRLYKKADWEGLTDRMSSVTDSCMALNSVNTLIHSMWNDLKAEVESSPKSLFQNDSQIQRHSSMDNKSPS